MIRKSLENKSICLFWFIWLFYQFLVSFLAGGELIQVIKILSLES